MKYLLFLFFILFSFFCNVIKDPYPELTSPVMDPSHFLNNESKQQLERQLLDEEKETTNQVVVYIADSLNKNTIEEETIAIFEKWKLGTKTKDNGVLFLLAPNDKKVRIEVGYGLEGTLTDVTAKRIIDEIIIPNMKSGNSTGAVVQGTNAILDQIRSDSPAFYATNCLESFNDKNGDLHPDTIPLLKKEIRPLQNIDFQFCVLPSETEWALESKATKLLLQKKQNKHKVVFAVSPNNNYLGTILVSPELNWSLSTNKIRTIFNKRYKEKQNYDFTNYSYLAFLDMLDYLSHKNKQVITKGTGVYDPHDALETFAFERSGKAVSEIETNYNLKTQILILDTNSDLQKDAKKFHKQAFGNTPAITVLFSINQKEIYVYTDENSFVSNPTINKSYSIDRNQLDLEIRNSIENDRKTGDIDWMCIRTADAIDSYLFNLKRSNVSNSFVETKVQDLETPKPHFLWQFYFALSFLIGFLGFIGGEGFLFFNALFFILWQKIRLHTSFLLDSPNFYQTISFFSSILIALMLVRIFRKLGWATKVHSSITNFVTSPSGSGSGSSSGSSYRSSSSSYSGGGGRSGGGGASGSW
ncbi:TPM domain-containing protein [Leptospira harrisiae]|uniref:TPM domain-containing protein n=1 Tax=Leptospira harrisiae TaxID=2023189 RepID=A0A2N0AMD9_9LEPT|nr:TPM domain-containing protein [Leptospira harrisiae]PJZ85476.1 hypothetical protein CH364_04415 [Leptospira harrisiae]PKA09013.1 hypothetical protein CH366_04555 [Leptospira harrisiae]